MSEWLIFFSDLRLAHLWVDFRFIFNVFWKLVSSCWGWQKLLETSNTLCIRVRVCLCLRPKASAVPTKPYTSATARQVWRHPWSSPLLRAVSSSGRWRSRQVLIRLIAFTEPTESQSGSHDMDKPKRSTFSGSACQWFGSIQLRKNWKQGESFFASALLYIVHA